MADIEKSLSRAPQGIGQPQDEENPEFEIELEGEENDAEEKPLEADTEDDEFNENLAETLGEDTLQTLSSDLLEDFESDLNSRKDWLQTYVDGLELLGLKTEERTEPWPGACGVYHPLLTEALVKFQADTMMETFPAAGPVRTKIVGEETPAKKKAAFRVEADMNNQLTNVMQEYRPEHERMLWGLGLSGNAFKKVYYDPALGRQTSLYVPAEDVVVPFGASNIQTTERLTHVMRKTENEVKRLQAAGFYRDVDLGEPSNQLEDIEKKIAEKMGWSATTDDRYKTLEMHVDLVIEDDKFKNEDGLALPYIVTIEKGSTEVLAIRRNWNPNDKKQAKRQHFVHYYYIPGFGFYAFGLIHLIGAFAKSGTSIIRQLVDAGTLSNLPGGFKTKALRIKGDDTPVSPGEFRDVDVGSGTIKDNIMTLPYKEPSQVLFTLLGSIVEEGRRFASAGDLQVSDMSAQAPVGTTLAILERALKVMSAVQARIHYSMKQEFDLLRDIIRDYTPDTYTYEPEDGEPQAKKGDYDLVSVVPVSDPNAATMAQKVVQYQAVIQLAQTAPQIYDLPFMHRQMLEILGINNASKLVPLEDDMKPKDPVSENVALLTNKPTKVFLGQDHDAHIAVHSALMQDPKTAATIGQGPQAQALMAAIQAHIVEHFGFAYRKQIEDQAGVPYPAPDEELDPQMEVQISRLAAAASQQVLHNNQSAQAQAAAQQAAQDPLVKLQQDEIAIKKQLADLQSKKLQVDAATNADKLRLEREKLASKEKVEGLKIGAKIGGDKFSHQSEHHKQEKQIAAEHERTGFQMASDHYKHGGQVESERQKQERQHTHEHTQKELDRLHQAQQSERAAEKAEKAPKPTKETKK